MKPLLLFLAFLLATLPSRAADRVGFFYFYRDQMWRVAHPSQPMKWVPHPSRLSSDGWESTNLNQRPRLYSQIQPWQSRFTPSCQPVKCRIVPTQRT